MNGIDGSQAAVDLAFWLFLYWTWYTLSALCHAEILGVNETCFLCSWYGRRCWQPIALACRTVMTRRWPPCVWKASGVRSALPASLECRYGEVSCLSLDCQSFGTTRDFQLTTVSANHLLIPTEKQPMALC